MKFKQAKQTDYKLIAGFQQKMAIETENYQLNIDTVTKGGQAVFNDITKGKYYIVEEDEKIIASLLTTYEWSDWRNSQVVWIQSVYVLPKYRGLGVFKLMYSEIKKIVSENENYSGIRLYVDKTNSNAIKVYNKIGMQGEHYSLFEDMKF